MKKKIYTLALALLGLFCSVDVMAQVEGLTPVTENLPAGDYFIYCTSTEKWLNDEQGNVFTDRPSAIWTLTGSQDSYTLRSDNGNYFSIYSSDPQALITVSVAVSTWESDRKTTDITLFSGNVGNAWSIVRVSNQFEYRWGTRSGKRNITVNNGALAGTDNPQYIFVFYTRADVERIYPMATAEEAAAYNNAMTTAAANMNNLGFGDGMYAPYNNVDAIKAYVENDKTIQVGQLLPVSRGTEFNTLISTLSNWTPNNGDVEAVGNSDFGTADGWTYSNNADSGNLVGGTSGVNELYNVNGSTGFHTRGNIFYGNTPGYTLPLEANTYYEFVFSYAASNYAIGASSSSGVNASILYNNKGLEAKSYSVVEQGEFPNALTTQRVAFKTAEKGNYVIKISAEGYVPFVGTNGTVITNIHLNKIFPGTTVTGDSRWGTFISQVDRDLVEGFEAYTVEDADGDVLVLEQVESIEANVPYLVKNPNKESEKVELPYVYAKDVENKAVETSYTHGLLTGVYERTTVPAGAFILYQAENYPMGFYKVGNDYAEGSEPYVNANRCYLNMPAGSQAKAFRLEGVVTAIEAAESLINGEMTEVYGINGAKQGDLQKGMNVVRFANGKTAKILVK